MNTKKKFIQRKRKMFTCDEVQYSPDPIPKKPKSSIPASAKFHELAADSPVTENLMFVHLINVFLHSNAFLSFGEHSFDAVASGQRVLLLTASARITRGFFDTQETFQFLGTA